MQGCVGCVENPQVSDRHGEIAHLSDLDIAEYLYCACPPVNHAVDLSFRLIARPEGSTYCQIS